MEDIHFRVRRVALQPTYAIGKMEYNTGSEWVYLCDTLEDTVRDLNRDGKFDNGEKKIWGKTAIPYGTYKFIVNHSPHLGYDTPLLLDVSDFDGIRIHIGNYTTDTDGCILVGKNTIKGQVTQSTVCFNALMALLAKYPQPSYTINIC